MVCKSIPQVCSIVSCNQQPRRSPFVNALLPCRTRHWKVRGWVWLVRIDPREVSSALVRRQRIHNGLHDLLRRVHGFGNGLQGVPGILTRGPPPATPSSASSLSSMPSATPVSISMLVFSYFMVFTLFFVSGSLRPGFSSDANQYVGRTSPSHGFPPPLTDHSAVRKLIRPRMVMFPVFIAVKEASSLRCGMEDNHVQLPRAASQALPELFERDVFLAAKRVYATFGTRSFWLFSHYTGGATPRCSKAASVACRP